MKNIFIALMTGIGISGSLYAAEEYQEGVSEYNNERYEKAIVLLEKAVSSNPTNHDAIYRLALAYTKTQQYRTAIDKFLLLQKHEKMYPQIYFEIARNCFTLKDYESARKYFRHSKAKGFKTEDSDYFLAFVDLQAKDYENARRGFRNLLGAKDKDLQQGSSMYLGTILYLEERDKKNAKFKEASGYLNKAVAMDARSAAGLQAQAVLDEIDKRLNPEKSVAKVKRWNLNGNLGLDYDNNVLNEADLMNPTKKTGKTGTKLSLGAGGSYTVMNSLRWNMKPNYSVSFGKYLTTDTAVNKSDSLSNSLVADFVYKNDMYGKPYEMPNSISATHSMSDSNSDGLWTWSGLTASITPKFKYQVFGSNYSTVGAGCTLNYVPTNVMQNNFEYKGTLSQTYSVAKLTTALDGAYKYTYIPPGHDASLKKTVWELGGNLSHPLVYEVTGSADGRATFTDNKKNPTRGREATYTFGLTMTRVFFNLFNVSVNWNTTKQTSKDEANYAYTKHVFGLKAAISY